MSRERARRAADQRKAEDDLSSLTSYWTNTVLTGAQFFSTQPIKWQLISIGFNPSYQPFPPHRLATRVAVEENPRVMVARVAAPRPRKSLEACSQQLPQPHHSALHHTQVTVDFWMSGFPRQGHNVKSSCRLNQNVDSPLCRTRAHSANESKETLQLVSLDVSRTFPQLGIFQVLPCSHSIWHQ